MNLTKLLVKFPTRGRPEKFLRVLQQYREAMALDTAFLINIDVDDTDMLSVAVSLSNANIHTGLPEGKIAACNRGLEHLDWDVLLLASDDMIPQIKQMDLMILNIMEQLYPDTDGALWFNDGFTGDIINTIVCIGRKRYEKFGYLYHPSYKSLFCDNEYTDVGKRDSKLHYIKDVILKHEHPMRVKTEKYDNLYKHNESFWKEDQANYYKRRKEGFPI